MKRLLIAPMLLLFLSAQAQDYTAGEKIFKANCAACHKMDSKVIGPPLQNTVAEQGFEWTKKWIYNNEELRGSGDAHALAIYEEYNKQVMPAYSFLSDEELTNLTTYLAEWKDKQAAPVAITDSEAGEAGKTTAVIQKPKRELTAGGKVVLGVLIFACVMVTITILTLYKAFKTMVEVNKELHRKAASYRRWRNDSAL